MLRALQLCLVLAATAFAAVPAVASAVTFQSPSGNIVCSLGRDGVRCDIGDKSWSVRKPRSCDLDYANGMAVDRSSRRGQFTCAGDTLFGLEGRTLAYGRSLRRGKVRCSSRQNGITCRNGRGHGFRLARADYRRF